MKQFFTRLWDDHIEYWVLKVGLIITLYRIDNPITRWCWKRRMRQLEKSRTKAQQAVTHLKTLGIELETKDLV